MAHEIEIVNGVGAVFSVKLPMWHKLGVVLDSPPTVKEAIVLSGLSWDVAVEPSFKANVSLTGTSYQEVPETKFVVRATDNKVLGTVGDKYKVVQNTEAFDWFQPFLDTGLVALETAGCLAGGRRIWVMAKFTGQPSVVKGNDIVDKYILLANSHDGSMAVTAGITFQRVVCQNTLSMADNSNASQLMRIRHTATVMDTLNKVRDIINVTNQQFEATLEQYQALADRVINTAKLESYVKIVLEQDKPADQLKARGKNQISRIIELFETGAGNDMPEIKNTWWTAYQAFADYWSHEASSTDDQRMNSLFFGQNATRSKVALKKALQLSVA